MPLWRGKLQNIYHNCSRCGTRQPLSRLTWQNGLLVCFSNDCWDTAIVGARDINVSRAVSVDRHELEPDRKLTEPVARKEDQSECLY